VETWLVELLFAIVAPFTLVALFTRVTYNKWVSILLALGMLIFVLRAFDRDVYLLLIGLISFFVGTIYSFKLEKKFKRRWK
jgi:general stress protein CsbA